MRRQDKRKNIEQANLMLEQSYLKNKGLLNENLNTKSVMNTLRNLLQDPKVMTDLEKISKNKEALDGIVDDMKNMTESEENEKEVLKNTLKVAGLSSISGAAISAIYLLIRLVSTGAVDANDALVTGAITSGNASIGAILGYLTSKYDLSDVEFKDVDDEGPFPERY